jgi:uncharacterized membrane protein YhaH (DUF805 family)
MYLLAIIIPGLAVGVKRLHDIGKSGWIVFIAVISIIGATDYWFFLHGGSCNSK